MEKETYGDFITSSYYSLSSALTAYKHQANERDIRLSMLAAPIYSRYLALKAEYENEEMCKVTWLRHLELFQRFFSDLSEPLSTSLHAQEIKAAIKEHLQR